MTKLTEGAGASSVAKLDEASTCPFCSLFRFRAGLVFRGGRTRPVSLDLTCRCGLRGGVSHRLSRAGFDFLVLRATSRLDCFVVFLGTSLRSAEGTPGFATGTSLDSSAPDTSELLDDDADDDDDDDDAFDVVEDREREGEAERLIAGTTRLDSRAGGDLGSAIGAPAAWRSLGDLGSKAPVALGDLAPAEWRTLGDLDDLGFFCARGAPNVTSRGGNLGTAKLRNDASVAGVRRFWCELFTRRGSTGRMGPKLLVSGRMGPKLLVSGSAI